MTLQNRRPNDSLRLIGALAKLRDGVTTQQASDEVGAIARRLAAEYPVINAGWGAVAMPIQDQVTAAVRPTLLMLLAGVGLVTLMACANLANLLLARSLRRRREMAIRSAIGAARGRLLRQTMTESALLSLLGAGVAWIAIDWLTRAFVAVAPGEIPRLAEIDRDWRVAIYTFGLALVTAVVAGWLPAISASRADLIADLGEASRGSTSGRGARMRSVLVASQVAVAVVLAFGTGLLVRSFITVVRVDPGFRTDNVLTMQIAVPRAYDTPDKRRAFYSTLFARLEAVPGISAVGGTTRLPLGGANSTTRVLVEGRDAAGGIDAGLRRAMHGYFDVMRIPLLRGRAFTSADGAQAPRVVVINQAMASKVFPGEDPIGRRVTLAENAGVGTATIVGIVGDVRHDGLEAAPAPEIYIHYLQNPPSAPLLVMRTESEPASLTSAVRAAVRDVDPAILAYDIRPMTVLRSQAMVERRFITAAATMFGAIAIALAMVGVYGVMALVVGERTQEIGIRLALGADPRAVLAMIVRQGLAVAAAGTICGLAAALALAPAISAQLYGVRPADLMTLICVAALLLGAAAAASLLPARRAMRVDPAATLR
jgi:putative ABC transport system permease protein